MKQLPFYLLISLILIPVTGPIQAEERTITVDGTIRQYIIEVPANYTSSIRHDLIIVYHGMGGSASQTMFTNFHNYGDQDHFITIYPQGLGDIDNPFNPGTTTTGWKAAARRMLWFTTANLNAW